MSLQAKLDAFKADFQAGRAPYFAPPWIHPIMERATRELIASGLAQRALKAGELAPGFALRDSEGTLVSSSELLAHGPLVLTFYRGVWCPYCNMELQALQDGLSSFEALGARVVAISPQNAASSRKAVRVNALSYPILSDTRNEVAASFGLRYMLPDYLIQLYKELKNDLPTFNGETSWSLPLPARYVVAHGGRILYAEINPDYTHRPEPSAMLPAVATPGSVLGLR